MNAIEFIERVGTILVSAGLLCLYAVGKASEEREGDESTD